MGEEVMPSARGFKVFKEIKLSDRFKSQDQLVAK
jgi:hypothetical protein